MKKNNIREELIYAKNINQAMDIAHWADTITPKGNGMFLCEEKRKEFPIKLSDYGPTL